MSFTDTRRLLSGGEAFLLMLQTFRVDNVTDQRLALAEAYADNVLFRPKNVEVCTNINEVEVEDKDIMTIYSDV